MFTGNCLGGKLTGCNCPGKNFMGVIVWRIIVQGKLFRSSCLGGKSPEGNCLGGNFIVVIVGRLSLNRFKVSIEDRNDMSLCFTFSLIKSNNH